MFTKIIRFIFPVCALLLSNAVQADVVLPHSPIETKDVTVMKAQPGGLMLVRPCPGCAMLSLQFDAKSEAFANGKPVGLTAIPEHPKTAITVIFIPTTKIVQQVLWTE